MLQRLLRWRMNRPNNAPIYAGIYQDLAKLFHNHGYALAIHGSLARDFDLIAIPWNDPVSFPQDVVDSLCQIFALKQIGCPENKVHNRLVYTISISYGDVFIDLSFVNINLPKGAES